MDTVLHIPWTNEALEELLQAAVNTGETAKLDFKSVWDIGTREQKAELARDIQAMANAHDPAYRNHGFLILGAKASKLLYTPFAENADKMQATVDQIVREHLGPFVATQVRQFGDGTQTWGAIVVPPSRNAPHVFLRDTAKYCRGDIFVRIGTTTAKAEPADFARFFRVHLEDYGRELREELREVQRDVERLKAGAHVTLTPAAPVPPTVAADVTTPREPISSEATPSEPPRAAVTPMNVLAIVQRGLEKRADPVSAALAHEASALRRFIDSRAIPWDLNNITRESGRTVIEQINERAHVYWKALAVIVENDDEGKYDSDVLDALSALAFDAHPPSGTVFTKYGTGIRFYPLTMALYIVFMIGVRKRKYKLLSEVRKLTLSPKSHYDEPLPIGTALYYARSADDVLQTMRDDYPEQRWCDAVGSYAERWISAHLYPDSPTMERSAHLFYVAEFLLSLLAAASANLARPSSGLFYYVDESKTIINRYLKSDQDGLKQIFGVDLRTALERFDQSASKIANYGRCWGDGFQGGATELVFPPSTGVLRK